jgi:hypothetical protein
VGVVGAKGSAITSSPTVVWSTINLVMLLFGIAGGEGVGEVCHRQPGARRVRDGWGRAPAAKSGGGGGEVRPVEGLPSAP